MQVNVQQLEQRLKDRTDYRQTLLFRRDELIHKIALVDMQIKGIHMRIDALTGNNKPEEAAS